MKKRLFLFLIIFNCLSLNADFRRKLEEKTPIESFIKNKRYLDFLNDIKVKTYGDLLIFLAENGAHFKEYINIPESEIKKQMTKIIDPILDKNSDLNTETENPNLLNTKDSSLWNRSISFIKEIFHRLFQRLIQKKEVGEKELETKKDKSITESVEKVAPLKAQKIVSKKINTRKIVPLTRREIPSRNINDIKFSPLLLKEIASRKINVGIINPGNRCYLLSLLQCLSQVNGFDIPNFDFNQLRQYDESIKLSKKFLHFISDLFEERYSTSKQQDPSELFRSLVRIIGNEKFKITVNVYNSNSYKPDKNVRTDELPFIDLEIPSEKHSSEKIITVYDLYNNYFVERERGDYYKIVNTSDYLVLTLGIFNKYKFINDQITPIKSDMKVKINEILDLTFNGIYEITGIVLHRGNTINSGHYISILQENGFYYIYNDDNVFGPFKNLDIALQYPFKDDVISFDPYMLFYKRV